MGTLRTSIVYNVQIPVRVTCYDVIHVMVFCFQAWKRLSVQRDHLDILKELQPNYNLVVLQHSPDKSVLVTDTLLMYTLIIIPLYVHVRLYVTLTIGHKLTSLHSRSSQTIPILRYIG